MPNAPKSRPGMDGGTHRTTGVVASDVHSGDGPTDLDRVLRHALQSGVLVGDGTLTRVQYYAVLARLDSEARAW